MIKSVFSAVALIGIMATGAMAAPNGVWTRASQCNASQLIHMKNSVDAIRNPLRHEAAEEELDTAVALLQDNDPDGCMAHLTNASAYVTP